MKITEAELLEALALAARGASPSEAKTTSELAEAARISPMAVRKALNLLKREGRLVIHPVVREALDGRPARMSGYTILPAKKLKR